MVTMKKSVTMEAVKSLLLEWDGDGSGLEAVETAGGTLYKVADVIVQNEDIPGMTVTDNEGKETLVTDSIYNDMISRSLVGDGFAAKVAGYVYLAQKAAQAPGAELPAGGIWLLKKQDGSYPKKVVLPAYREAFLQGEKPDGEKGESMGGGAVKSVNGQLPDENGDVTLEMPEGVGGEIPFFDLAEMGLPALTPTETVSVSVDTTAIIAALEKGLVRLKVKFPSMDQVAVCSSVAIPAHYTHTCTWITTASDGNYVVQISIAPGTIYGTYTVL